jgi:Putative zinc-finger
MHQRLKEMNCENYQILLSEFVDGTLTAEDCTRVELHLSSCPDCVDARNDLRVIVDFCREQRGQYDAVPNERAMWLRISNLLEAEDGFAKRADVPRAQRSRRGLMGRTWQLSFPQLAGRVGGVVITVALATGFSVRSWSSGGPTVAKVPTLSSSSIEERYRQRQQTIAYWNQRVELNKARWNAQMRETFDRNMSVIDAAVTDSMNQLNLNPHDSVSEDILNDALNDKVALLKEFSDL